MGGQKQLPQQGREPVSQAPRLCQASTQRWPGPWGTGTHLVPSLSWPAGLGV